MASGKSLYLRNAFLNLSLGGATWTPPATIYVALTTSAWSASATGTSITATEPSGGGYARKSAANDTTTWPTTTVANKANGIVISFNTATTNWGTIQAFYIVDAATNGNILWGGDLYTARAVLAGDAAKFAENQLHVTEA